MDDVWTLAQAAQGGCEISILGDIFEQSGHDPGKPALERLFWITSGLSFQPQPFHNFVIMFKYQIQAVSSFGSLWKYGFFAALSIFHLWKLVTVMMKHSATCLLAQKFQMTTFNELSLTTTCDTVFVRQRIKVLRMYTFINFYILALSIHPTASQTISISFVVLCSTWIRSNKEFIWVSCI